MATKATTPAQKLGITPVPARVSTRKAAPVATPKSANFHAWKDAISTARSAAGYDETSPIFGHTDVEVLTDLRTSLSELHDNALKDGSITPTSKMATELEIAVARIDELLKRKVAKQIAGQTYRTARA